MLEKIEQKVLSLEELTEQRFKGAKQLPGVQFAFRLINDKLPEKYPALKNKFSEVLPYHGLLHADDVLYEAILFATAEGISDSRELELLAIAAAFHDAGFIEKYDKNEPFGANLAIDYMKQSGRYSEEEIERVRQIVLSTQVEFKPEFQQLVQNPKDILQKIMADADVSNFGREDFDEKAGKVFSELLGVGQIPADTPAARMSFDKFREKMLKNHSWQTDSARRLREVQKQKNLEILTARVG